MADITRDIGVALVNREGAEVRYSMTDEFMHYCGDVIVGPYGDDYRMEDKYGTPIPHTNPLYGLMLRGLTKYLAWAESHGM